MTVNDRRDDFSARLAAYRESGDLQFHDHDDRWRPWRELSPQGKLAYVAVAAACEGVSAARFAEAAREALAGVAPDE